ncbi:MAG TPA: hypothetical protein VGI85_00990 [Chthoniobacterales bacterium]|jgi:hypothetical protein
MLPKDADFSPGKKLESLRAVDIFHPWESIDEKRLCLRCGQIISGREIKVCGGEGGRGALRLECPTEGCPAVPIEWVMLDCSTELPAAKAVAPSPPEAPLPPLDDKSAPRRRPRPSLFKFLRVAPVFV